MLHPPRSPHLTPKHSARPQPPLPSVRNLTPSRIEERVASSPLRQPLQNAIYHTVRDRSNERHSQSRSRVLGRSSRRDYSGVRRLLMEDNEAPQRLPNAETQSFLKRNFDLESPIPVNNFIDCLLVEYEGLWEGQDNVDYLLSRFGEKVIDIFGDSVEPRKLMALTREGGMLGFIQEVFISIN